MPVLLLSGSENPAVFPLLNNDLSRRLPDARKQVIQGALHMVHEDAHSALNEVVLGFLKGVNQGSEPKSGSTDAS